MKMISRFIKKAVLENKERYYLRKKNVPSTLPIFNKPGFLPELHALRGIGAVCIVLFHLSPVGGIKLPEQLGFITNYFGFAVVLFFVLSGFSLYHTTFSKINTHNWIEYFYIKRFFRIAPLFYFVLIVQLSMFLYWGVPINFTSVLSTIFFIFAFLPGLHESVVMAGWVVGIEAVFYIVFPMLLIVVKRRPGRIVLMLLFLTWVSITARTWFAGIKGISPSYPYMNALTHSVAFGAGIGSWYLFSSIASRWKKRLAYPCMLGFIFSLFLLHMSYRWGYFISPEATHVPIYAFGFGMLTVAMLFGALPFLTNKVTVSLGELSYSIFLLHPVVIALMSPTYKRISGSYGPLHTYLFCAAITLLVVVPLAYFTYTFIEVKGIQFGKKFLTIGTLGNQQNNNLSSERAAL